MLAIRAFALVALAAATVPAQAVTFASYTQVGNATTFRFGNSGNLAARTTDATFMTNTRAPPRRRSMSASASRSPAPALPVWSTMSPPPC